MNIFVGTGRLTSNANYSKGTPVMNSEASRPKLSYARFNVAVDYPGRKDKPTFMSVTCFGKTADYVGEGITQGRYLKGCEVEFAGPIELGSYTTQQGEQRSYIGVIANRTRSQVHKDYKDSVHAQTQNNYQKPNSGGVSTGHNQRDYQNQDYEEPAAGQGRRSYQNQKNYQNHGGVSVARGQHENNGYSPASKFKEGYLPDNFPTAPEYNEMESQNEYFDYDFQPVSYEY